MLSNFYANTSCNTTTVIQYRDRVDTIESVAIREAEPETRANMRAIIHLCTHKDRSTTTMKRGTTQIDSHAVCKKRLPSGKLHSNKIYRK